MTETNFRSTTATFSKFTVRQPEQNGVLHGSCSTFNQWGIGTLICLRVRYKCVYRHCDTSLQYKKKIFHLLFVVTLYTYFHLSAIDLYSLKLTLLSEASVFTFNFSEFNILFVFSRFLLHHIIRLYHMHFTYLHVSS